MNDVVCVRHTSAPLPRGDVPSGQRLPADQRQALRAAPRTVTSASGRWLMRHRGEFCERNVVHVLDYGGARRTTLRGRENTLKRYFVQAACLNLSILLRHLTGVGTLKQTWAASARAVAGCLRVLEDIAHELQGALRALSRLSSPTSAQVLARLVAGLPLTSPNSKLSSSTVC